MESDCGCRIQLPTYRTLPRACSDLDCTKLWSIKCTLYPCLTLTSRFWLNYEYSSRSAGEFYCLGIPWVVSSWFNKSFGNQSDIQFVYSIHLPWHWLWKWAARPGSWRPHPELQAVPLSRQVVQILVSVTCFMHATIRRNHKTWWWITHASYHRSQLPLVRLEIDSAISM